MMKKLILWTLVLSLLLCGCGGEAPAEETTIAVETTMVTEPETEPTTVPATTMPQASDVYADAVSAIGEDITTLMAAVQAHGGQATELVVGMPLPAPHHNGGFDVDERVLGIGARCLAALALSAARYGIPRCEHMLVKITVPENLNYQGLFDDIFKEYATSFRLKKVKTTDFGALFEVVYFIELKKDCDQKEFVDKLRSRNGNLNVALIFKEYEDKLYEN